jgi:hypothetical protein
MVVVYKSLKKNLVFSFWVHANRIAGFGALNLFSYLSLSVLTVQRVIP